MKIRKRVAGADSYGNFWENDGDVIEVEAETAARLVAIPDGGYSIAEDAEEFHDDTRQGLADGLDLTLERRMAVKVTEDAEDEPHGRPVRDADVRENLRPGGEGRDQGAGPHAANQATVGEGSLDGEPGVTRTPDAAGPLDPAQNSATIGPAPEEGTTVPVTRTGGGQ